MIDTNYNKIGKKDSYIFYNKEDEDHNFYFRYNQPSKTKHLINKYFKIFALVPVIIMLITLVSHINNNNKIPINNIYDTYYKVTLPDISRSSNDNISINRQIYNAFYLDNKETTIEVMEKIASEHNTPQVNFFLAISYQENNQFEDAIIYYKKVLKDNNNIFLEDANWNLTLCFIKTKKIIKAEYKLLEIAVNDTFYSEKAKIIYKLLN